MSRGTIHSVETARRRAKKPAQLARIIVGYGWPKNRVEYMVRQPEVRAAVLQLSTYKTCGAEDWATAAEIAREFSRG